MKQTLLLPEAEPARSVEGDVHFSACGGYRYTLTRWWGERDHRRHVCFVGLNPSKAGELGSEDPTSMKFHGFARRLGALSYTAVNAFALISTDPSALLTAQDPVGPGNNDVIAHAAALARVTIVCWGATDGKLRKLLEPRVKAVLGVLKNRDLWCLGTTKDGSPRHPLYLSYSCKPQIWRPRHG